ncbi:probable ATP-dependent RNA helicase DDX10 isoform X1 [Haliotis rufescens]|uniref:probable ATP-dependent RNA helicase DDX10 isoform X1 n=1 Tax=Haliotis rufescens TaxID=6454 RepID=UPI00201F7077|nr:probable ATP-dependent RNA helicase DDX10 isoform X1 [Haliotis rufescens]
MNPKFQTEYKQNRPKGNISKGHKGKFKKQHYTRKPRLADVTDSEIAELKSRYKFIVPGNIETFADLPLCERTLKGLDHAKYTSPTEIQRESIGLALQGLDILGAAQTGSGKTLAFLLPVLECLYRQKWSSMDGMGALIISPTRELAYQTFEVLRKIGKLHDFSAGLVIGGKHLKEESERINQTNIVICTPGRLLQHMDETVNFTADALQILVLDEADRILDMGFAQTMNAIIENLPAERQTLLFSATQTKSVKDLARLSLANPMYVSVHEHSQHSTPAKLTQSYIVCELHEKLGMLWSFVKNHLKSKVLVFLSCCKEVKYIYEAFKRMRPGVTVLCLHGAMNQLRRVEVYNSFCRKHNALLLATDVAARGLDFPAVNWVVQLDCPEDANTYIHRAGRTARYEKDGEALLVLLPSEEDAMVQQLQDKKIPVNRIKVNTKKLSSVQPKLESLCAAEPALKEIAQRAFVAYLRGVFLMSNKAVFDVSKLDIDKFARSLGLAVVPRVRFLQRDQKRRQERLQDKHQEKQKTSTKVLMRATHAATGTSGREGRPEGSSSASSGDEDEGNLQQIIQRKFNESSTSMQGNQHVLKSLISNRTSDTSESEDGETDKDESEDSDVESHSDDDSEEESEDSDVESHSDKEAERTNMNAKVKSRKTDRSVPFRFDVDDDDDLFRVKRTIHVEDEDSEDEMVTRKKESLAKKKPTTKAKAVKKLLKKNIQLNTKVKFDEAGEEVSDIYKKPQVKKIFEDDDDLGGINIAAARQRLQEEDKFDKQLHREKVKQKHREERFKKKDERRKKQQAAEEHSDNDAMLNTEAGASAIDLIPDPEKIYGTGGSFDDDDDDTRDSYDDDDDDDRPSQAKRMRPSSPDVEESDKEDESDDVHSSDDDPGDRKLGVDERLEVEEEMALRLLRGCV